MPAASGFRPVLTLLLLPLLLACGRGPAGDDLIEGRFFPPLVVQSLYGSERKAIVDYRGRMVILNVWATWCPPCRRELPSLQRLQDRLDPSQYVVLGLSVDDDADFAREYLLERGIHFENFIDAGGRDARRLLGIRAYPDTFVISPDGVLLRSIAGERDWDAPTLVQALEAAFAGDAGALRSL
ncbi:MAG: TlpA disulfide reductase family protein [Gammaproteobacteria bacterium]|nr:TlpA disulfide reductase family protein [Gammaproteobacteria bacterium]